MVSSAGAKRHVNSIVGTDVLTPSDEAENGRLPGWLLPEGAAAEKLHGPGSCQHRQQRQTASRAPLLIGSTVAAAAAAARRTASPAPAAHCQLCEPHSRPAHARSQHWRAIRFID